MRTTLRTTLLALSLAGSAFAFSPADRGEKIELEATPRGYELETKAVAARSVAYGVDRLQLRAHVDLPDGTILQVAIDRGHGYEDVGSARVRLGTAFFSADSTTQPSSPAFPVSDVTAVSVSLRGSMLAEGKF